MLTGSLSWLTWLSIAIILTIVECFTTQFIFIWFAVGALLNAILSVWHISFVLQMIVLFVTGLILLFILRPVFIKRLSPKKEATNSDQLIGKTITLSHDLPNGHGRLSIDGMDWKVQADTPLHHGDIVQVTAIQGVTLKIIKL